jgi:hypothetical protein
MNVAWCRAPAEGGRPRESHGCIHAGRGGEGPMKRESQPMYAETRHSSAPSGSTQRPARRAWRCVGALALALSCVGPVPATPEQERGGAVPQQVGSQPAPALPEGPLERDTSQRYEYLSDFFVFVGREVLEDPTSEATGKGLVLAFDANRGRDREKFAAEHFAVLWVEGRGWVDVDATTPLPGATEHFSRVFGAPLPSSERAKVTGTAASGLVLEVPKVELVLEAEPMVIETDRRHGRDAFVTGSSMGKLTLGAREFVGVVHQEFTYLAGINPLAKTYTDLFGDAFHSVYALVGERGALRMHRSGGRLEPLIGRHSGYLVLDEASRGSGELAQLELETAKKSLGGLFRWPGRYKTSWESTVDGEARKCTLQVDLKHRDTLINYVFGGVAIAIAQGEFGEGAQKQRVLGFSLIVL